MVTVLSLRCIAWKANSAPLLAMCPLLQVAFSCIIHMTEKAVSLSELFTRRSAHAATG